MQKHQLLHASQTLQSNLNELQSNLEKEYGKVSINIQDGTYVPVESEEEVLEPDNSKK